MFPEVRIGAVLCPSWNLTAAMLWKEEFMVVVDIVILSSSEESVKELLKEGMGVPVELWCCDYWQWWWEVWDLIFSDVCWCEEPE
jgi:hypothetical protein